MYAGYTRDMWSSCGHSQVATCETVKKGGHAVLRASDRFTASVAGYVDVYEVDA